MRRSSCRRFAPGLLLVSRMYIGYVFSKRTDQIARHTEFRTDEISLCVAEVLWSAGMQEAILNAIWIVLCRISSILGGMHPDRGASVRAVMGP